MKQTAIISGILAFATVSSLSAKTSAPFAPHDPESAVFAARLQHLSEKVREIEQQMSSSANGSHENSEMDGMKGMKGSSKMVGMGEMDKDKMDGMKDMDGMKMKKRGMGMMGEMGMMQGMDGMDSMDGMDGMTMPSALPGFPGASHLYHIGATGFFLNHGEHIKLSTEQQTKLNELKESALLSKATSERKVAEAEQELWKLTSSGEPDAKMIEEKIREIEKIRGDQRLDFIRAVGEAAKLLTHEQHQALTGKHSATGDQPDPATDHSDHNKD